jgi:hypothetical protein
MLCPLLAQLVPLFFLVADAMLLPERALPDHVSGHWLSGSTVPSCPLSKHSTTPENHD